MSCGSLSRPPASCLPPCPGMPLAAFLEAHFIQSTSAHICVPGRTVCQLSTGQSVTQMRHARCVLCLLIRSGLRAGWDWLIPSVKVPVVADFIKCKVKTLARPPRNPAEMIAAGGLWGGAGGVALSPSPTNSAKPSHALDSLILSRKWDRQAFLRSRRAQPRAPRILSSHLSLPGWGM